MKTLLSAAYIAQTFGEPVVPPARDSSILFTSQEILAVGPTADLVKLHSDANHIDLGNAIILPGLINAHTHLELTSLRQFPKPASFVDWILALRKKFESITDFPAFIQQSVRAGIDQCLRFGVTAVGDITLNPALSRPLLAAANLRGVSFGEVLGMAGRVDQLPARIAAAMDSTFQSPTLRIGIEPHAPYSLDLTGYTQCLQIARDLHLPLATHLAETPDEAPFLASHTGPFRRLWDALGAWNDNVSRANGGPIRAMHQLGLLNHSILLAHVNYVDDAELDLLAQSQATVVYCPRTHAYFGHPSHPIEKMLARGINVAIGTDSCASSPDLNLLDDLRLVHQKHPALTSDQLWSLVTTRPAKALGMENKIGALIPARLPDFCIFDAAGPDPLQHILESPLPPVQTWLSGRAIQS